MNVHRRRTCSRSVDENSARRQRGRRSRLPNDPHHAAARARLRGVVEGRHQLFLPSVFMAEVVSGARRQGNLALGLTAARDIAARATVKSISQNFATSAGEIIATVPLRGFDAIDVQLAIEYNATLITSDLAVLTHAPCEVASS